MSANANIRILVVNSQPLDRLGLGTFFESQPGMSVVAQAATGEQGVKLSRTVAPDIVVMDLRLPGISGVAAMQAIRAQCPRTRFVVLTTYDGDDDIHRALGAGARAYLIKGMPLESLADAVRKVHAGLRVLPPVVEESLAAWTPNSDLTSRERDVLSLIVEGKTNKMIGKDLHITEGTVKCHVNVILRRLAVSCRSEAAITALRRGIVHL